MAKLRRRSERPGARRRRSLAEPLEPRILLSADLPGLHDDPALPPHDDPGDGRHELVLSDESAGTTAEQHAVRRELVFVDAGVEGYEQLVDDLRERAGNDSTLEVHVLGKQSDGIAQIGDALAAHAGDVDAVHVISHGTEGGLQLGGTWLSSESLESRAASLAEWSSAFSNGADLLLYGCNLAGNAEGQQLVDEIATLTGADVAASADLTGAAVLGGDWELEYASGSVETAAFGAAGPVPFSGVLRGTAIWVENGSPVPQTSQFDNIAFGTEDVTAAVDGAWLVTAGAESPTRNEMIVLGVDVDGKLSGQMWDGAAWTALPFNADLPKLARNDSQSFDVAYDSVTGNAMLVYNNGVGDTKSISYRIWDGMKWSDPGDIALPAAGEVEHIQLAVKPGSQEIVLVAGNEADKSFALVWDGGGWGNAASLHDGTGSQGNTHLSVSYEQQGGNAMVVYAKGDDALYYRQWDGSVWRSEGSISAPSGAIGQPLWTSIASNPTSDRMALGVLTQQNDVWLATWNGNSWQHNTLATNDSPNSDRPNVAVAFESISGQAIATYSTSDSRITYRTWTSGNWSSEQFGPDLGERSKAMTLDADPDSDQLMLSVAEHSNAVSFIAWNGTAWSAPNQLESDTGTGKGQPFLFVWEAAPVPGRPTADASNGAPYVIREGESVSLDATSSTDPQSQPLTYQWDLDGDGIFGEAGEPTGANPTVAWAELRNAGIDNDGAYQIGLRVTDSDSQYDTTAATLTVQNTAPTISVSGPSSVSVGASYTLNFAASDPGNETIVGWTINWGDGTIDTVGDVTSASHVYTKAGFTRNITLSVTQDDGTTWTNSDLLVGNWLSGVNDFHRFDGSTGDFVATNSSGTDLDRPYAIIIGPDGSYYVSGYDSHNIGRFDSDGNYLGEFVAPGTGGLNEPDGLAWGPDGNLYVANFGGNNILRFDASGNFIDVFGNGGGGMNGPSGIAFGPDGDLYVSSWTNSRIMRYDGLSGGNPTLVVNSGLASPEQLLFDDAGNLYIADGANNSVKMWDGSSLTTYFTDPLLNWATGLAFGPDGALYVASYNNDLILRYDGTTSSVFVAPGSGSLDEPEYLFFTPDLQVRVTGTANAPVVTGATTEMDAQTTSGLVIDRNVADGAEVGWFKISGIMNGTLYHNDGTTPINDGDFITFAEGNAGLRFTPSPGYVGPASILVQASTAGDNTDLSPSVSASITVTPFNELPVADASGGAPYVIQDEQDLRLDASRSYDPEGGPLTYEWDLDNDGVFGEPGEPTSVSPLVPEADLENVGIDVSGSFVIGLRVTDSGGKSHTTTTGVWVGDTTQTVSVTGAPDTIEGDIYTLNLAAQVPGDAARSWTINWGDGTIDTLGDVASATHIFDQPGYTRNITVSVSTEIGTWTNSDLLVGSWQPGIDTIHLFDGTTGDFEFVATSSGGVIQRPSTIALGPDGNYYVSGYDSHNIGLFDASGSYLGEFIASGTPGLVNPDGLAFGPDGNLYVANAGGNNILRFDSSGTFIDVFGSGGDIDKPTGIAFAPDGGLYVASWNNGKVLRLDGGTGGTPTTIIDSGLTEPEELLFDAGGNLYIADGATSSVRMWDGSSLTTHFSDPALVYATGMTFGPDGALYVASHNNDRIVRFDGVDSSIFVVSGSAGLNQPEYLLFTPELQVHVNHRVEAPTVTGATTSEDVQSTSGLVIDRNAADGLEVSHFKITGITNGTLYHSDGTTPINEGDFITWAEGNAGLRFTPVPDYFGPASFDVQASSTGDDSNLSIATTANITVTAVNDAPLLDASGGMMLTDVIEDDSDPAGSSVASIIASAGGDRITDVDPGALEGIAVIGVDDSNGTWEYSTDGGGSWSSFTAQAVPSASTDDTAAVLLADDALVRFVPSVGYAGSAGSISFRAWDQSSGASGDTAIDVSSNGNSTPYSTDIETATSNVVAAVEVAHLVPGAQSTDEDTTLVFSSATGNAVTVHDGSSGDLLLQTTLSVANGTLNLATTVGLSFDAGADGSASLTISGAESAINAALDGLRFTPTADYSGPADLQMATRLADPTLLAYYSFDGASPGLDDGALPTSDGILQGGVGTIYDAARGGNVMDFDGSDDSVRIPGLFGEPASLTLAAWVNLDSGFINGELISLGNNVSLRVDHSGGGDFGVIGFFWDGSSFQHTDSNLFINGTGWRHVAFAFDDANDLQTVYIDGAPIATSALSQSISYTLGTDTYLGRHGGSGSYYLNGKLDDMRVYDRALAGSEIAALFNEQTIATDSIAITVDPVNDAPQGTDASVGTLEDISYVFSATDFGFSDPVEGDAFAGVVITTAPGAGTLRDGVTVLGDGATVSAASIAAGNLTFTPAADANGDAYTSFTFQVRDDGGALNGGADLDPTPRTLTIDVTPVNDAPAAADDGIAVAEGGNIAIDLAANDTDVDDGLDLASIQIISGPANGNVTVNADGTVDYTHDGSETNADSFTYTIRDAAGQPSNTATVSLTVTQVNDPPQASPDWSLVAEGGTVTIDLAANDTDVDDGLDLASIQIISGPTNGSVAVNMDGTVDYTHDGSETNADSFTYAIRDASGEVSNTETVVVGVWPVNDVPTAIDDTATVAEGGSVTIDLAGNDSDPDDGIDPASIQIVTGPASGSIAVNADGTVDYTHDGSETSADSFTYTIRDAAGQVSSVATVDLTVTPVNDAPVAADDSATVAEGGSVAIDLAANDSDVDSSLDPASIQIVSGPANGTLVINPDGTVDYNHDGSETNADSFTYTIRDATGQVSNAATVDLTITPVNDAPVAADDSATVAEGGSVTIDLAANDSDVDSSLDPASIQIVSGPANGTLVINADGTVDYNHDGSETNADSFTYTIRDATGQVSNAATVDLTVTPVNDAPVAADDSATVAEGGSVTIDLAANDSDPDDGIDPATIQIVSGPANGTLVINPDGTVDYTHDGSETNADSFTYTIRDATGQVSTTATVDLTVTPVNDAPVAADDSATVAEGGSVTIDLAANDSDPDDGIDPATIQIVSGPANGTLVINPDGTVDYTHDGSETNADSFTYTIRDATGQVSTTATVDLTVTPVNDAPVAADDSATVAEGGSVTIDLAANDSDVDSSLDPATIQIVSGPANGTLVINADGTVDYNHDGSETNADSFTYTIRDATGQVSNAATVDLTVTPVNDAPVAADDSATVAEGGSVTIDLAANDSDPDDGIDPATTQIVSGPANGTLVINPDGTVDYNHDGSETNADSFTYTIRDATGQVSTTATVDLTVTPVNDAPVAADDSATVAEGGSVTIDLAANDSDVDSSLDPATIQIVSGPANGTLVINADGTVDYNHDGSETNADSFTYTIRDAAGQASNVATVDLSVTPVNDAPAGADNTVATAEDTPYVFTVADFGFSDLAEGNALQSVVITTAPTAGTLRDGATVLIGGETVSAASIAAGNLVFTPAPDATGPAHASFDFQVRDDGGTLGGGFDLDQTPNTITIDVTTINDAPLLVQSAPSLGSITEDDVGNSGESVATILGSSMSDADAGASEGIAITRLSSGNGVWQYSTDGGTSWTPIGSVGSASALLLRDADRIRFVPDGENADSASFDFRAWDRTSGVFASKADARSTGGSTAFSSTSDTAAIAVSPVNDAPALRDAAIAPVTGDAVDSPGESVGSLFTGRFSDVDSGARMSGIAVVGNGSSSGTQGDWQYSSDGGNTWFAIGAAGDDSSALALNMNTRLRFVPASGFDGSPQPVRVRALDETYTGGFSSTAGGSEIRANVDTRASGGSASISGTTATVSTHILTAQIMEPPDTTPSTQPIDEAPQPADDPAVETGETRDEPVPESSTDAIPFGSIPDTGEQSPTFAGRGSSSQPFSDVPADVVRLELETEVDAKQTPRTHDPRGQKAEERAEADTREDKLGFVHSASDLARELDRLRREVEVDSVVEQRVFGSSIALTAGLSIGYIVWLTRGGLLIASLVSSMPVWRLIDPVPILAGLGTRDDEDDEGRESLDSMLEANPGDEDEDDPPPTAEDHRPPASDESERQEGS